MSTGGDAPQTTVTFDTGTNAVSGTNISVAGNPESIQTLTATVPPHSPGLVSITVDNGLESVTVSATCNDGLSYGGDNGNGGTACNGQLDNGETRNGDRANVVSGFLYEEPYLAISLNTNSVNIEGPGGGALVPSVSGTYGYSSNTATTTTNNPTGYILFISTDQLNSNPNAKDLKHQSLNQYIVGTANTCTWTPGAVGTPGSLTNTTSQLSNNTWGFTLNAANRNAEQLCQIPASDTPLTIKQSTTAKDTGDNTDIYYGSKVDLNAVIGTYLTSVVYTVVGE
jgi:hypothetical protein